MGRRIPKVVERHPYFIFIFVIPSILIISWFFGYLKQTVNVLCWAASFFVFVALAMKEPEEKIYQGKLEELWCKIDDYKKKPVITFIRVLSGHIFNTVNKIFGEKLFSIRFLTMSSCYSLASCSFYILIVICVCKADFVRQNPVVVVVLIAISLLFTFLGSFPMLIKKRFGAWIPLILLACYFCFSAIAIIVVLLSNPEEGILSALGWMFMLMTGAGSLIFDAVLIKITSRILRLLSSNTSLLRAILLVSILFFGGLVIWSGPLFIAGGIKVFLKSISSGSHPFLIITFTMLQYILAYIGASNIPAALVSISLFILSAVMLLYRFALIPFDITIYFMQRKHIFERKWLLFVVGTIFFCIPIFGMNAVINAAKKMLVEHLFK